MNAGDAEALTDVLIRFNAALEHEKVMERHLRRSTGFDRHQALADWEAASKAKAALMHQLLTMCQAPSTPPA